MSVLQRRRIRKVTATAAVTTLALYATTSSASAVPQPDISRIWSGVYANPVSSTTPWQGVTADFTVPKVTCRIRSDTLMIWVGLGGATGGGDALVQTGVEASCASGKPVYHAFWELYDKRGLPETPIAGITVRPKDEIRVNVFHYNDDTPYSMQGLVNRYDSAGRVTQQTWRQDISLPAKDKKPVAAECIVEAPLAPAKKLTLRPLAKYSPQVDMKCDAWNGTGDYYYGYYDLTTGHVTAVRGDLPDPAEVPVTRQTMLNRDNTGVRTAVSWSSGEPGAPYTDDDQDHLGTLHVKWVGY